MQAIVNAFSRADKNVSSLFPIYGNPTILDVLRTVLAAMI